LVDDFPHEVLLIEIGSRPSSGDMQVGTNKAITGRVSKPWTGFDTSISSAAALLSRLLKSDAPLVREGVISEERLLQRARWLHEDLEQLSMPDFCILPTREITDQNSGLLFKVVEYVFGPSGHDVEKASPGFKKDPHLIDGTGLNRESLSRFAQISEAGHTVIPHLWLGNKTLRERVHTPTQHLDTLNEVWWLSRWHGAIPDSVEMEYSLLGGAKNRTPTVDWRFRVLDGAITINLEVKNRRGTAASKPMKKGVYLFGENPEKPFRPSREDEINVLAITGYHAGAISKAEEHRLVQNFLDQPLVTEVLDAVALYVVGRGSHERLFFPNNRPLHTRDLILRSLLKPETIEDHSRIIYHRFPISWEELGVKHADIG
jgi:hypothetical protein